MGLGSQQNSFEVQEPHHSKGGDAGFMHTHLGPEGY